MNLTTLANVRAWVGSTTDTDNALLTRLITMASQQILQHLQRPDLGLTTITETISGRGERKLQLRNWPVLAVNSLSINGQSVPASTGPTVYGFALEAVYGGVAGRPQNLGIAGAWDTGFDAGNGVAIVNGVATFAGPYSGIGARPLPPGVNNIVVNYSYGYCVQGEAQTIPASTYQITPKAPYGSWGGDNGVSYASGAALTPIASGTPSVGQYVPPNLSGDSPTPYYQFAAADVGAGVLLNYNYVPAQVEQACIETVGERYRYKSRIGQKSQSLSGQETASYDLSGLTVAVMEMLAPFRLEWGG
jgi:hypothetical protein